MDGDEFAKLINSYNLRKKTALHLLMEGKKYSKVKILLEFKPGKEIVYNVCTNALYSNVVPFTDVSMKDEFGRTCLHAAFKNNAGEIIVSKIMELMNALR